MTWISSGSKAEGLDMKTSDMDILVVFEFANVVEDPVLSFGLFSFLISSEYTKPGFVRLKLDKALIHIDIFLQSERWSNIPVKRLGEKDTIFSIEQILWFNASWSMYHIC